MAECRGQELPRYTVEVARLMDAPRQAEGTAAWRAMLQAVSKVYDEAWLADELGGRRLEDVDLIALRALYEDTRSAYGEGERQAGARSMADAMAVLDSIPVDRLQALGEAIAAIYAAEDRAKGFKRVV